MNRYHGNTRGISPGISPGNATLRSGMDLPGNATLRSGKSANQEIGDPRVKTANREIGNPRVGWEIKKLRDVCIIKPPKNEAKCKLKADDKVSFVPMEDLGINQKILLPKHERPLSEVAGSYTYFAENDVLLAKITPCFENGKLGIAKNLRNKIGFGSSEYIVFRTKDTLYNEYLYYFLSQDNFRINGAKRMTGAVGHKRVAKEYIEESLIPLPPLPEQQRIVAILDEAFAAIAKAKANAEQNLKNAKELFESYLQSVFENKGEGWEEKRLGDVANTNGRIGWKGLTAKEYTKEGPLFISVHSLNYGDYVDFRDAFHISQARYDESPEIMLQKDDILICKDGAGIGKLGIIPELPDVATINSSLLLIRCKKEIATKYLYYNLLSPIFQSIVQSRLSGATTPHLYQRDIVTFPIWLPKLKNQQAIVQKLDALSAETKRLEAIYQQKIEDLEELKKSVLAKAFKGEL